MASLKGHVEVVKALVAKRQINVNQAQTGGGATPLFVASAFGHVEVVKVLLKDPQIDPNMRQTEVMFFNSKWAPVQVASYFGHLEVVKVLLRCHKTDLKIKDDLGRSPLDLAKEDVRKKDKQWYLKLHWIWQKMFKKKTNSGNIDNMFRERKRETVKTLESHRLLLEQGRTC